MESVVNDIICISIIQDDNEYVDQQLFKMCPLTQTVLVSIFIPFFFSTINDYFMFLSWKSIY